MFFFFFFFFQAEDGIRDLYVTGVQTCALPISTANTLRQGRKEVSGVLSVAESKCPGCVVSSEWTCPLSGLGDIHREHARRRRLRQNTLALMKREESKLLVTGLRVKDVLKGLKT